MKALAEGLDGNGKHWLQNTMTSIEPLRGNAAAAMEERLGQLINAAAGLREEIAELAGQLYAYADLMEQADEQIATEL